MIIVSNIFRCPLTEIALSSEQSLFYACLCATAQSGPFKYRQSILQNIIYMQCHTRLKICSLGSFTSSFLQKSTDSSLEHGVE